MAVWFLADDHSRVRLSHLDGEPHSDYINANFVPVSAPLLLLPSHCSLCWATSFTRG